MKRAAQLVGLPTEERLQAMIEWINYFPVGTVFSIAVPLVHKNLGVVESCGLTRMDLLYTGIVNKTRPDQRAGT